MEYLSQNMGIYKEITVIASKMKLVKYCTSKYLGMTEWVVLIGYSVYPATVHKMAQSESCPQCLKYRGIGNRA